VEPGTPLTLPSATCHDCRVSFAIVTAQTVAECERRPDLVAFPMTVEVAT
jgi:hypothetical protein